MQNKNTGIKADKPIPPWEQPGCFRLDGKPHRGEILWWLATGSFFLSVFALFMPCFGWMPGLISFATCLTISDLTFLDLEEMETGSIDPWGKPATEHAARLVRFGTWFSAIGMILWGPSCLLIICRCLL